MLKKSFLFIWSTISLVFTFIIAFFAAVLIRITGLDDTDSAPSKKQMQQSKSFSKSL